MPDELKPVELAATHQCTICGARWRQCDDFTWTLRSPTCGPCCDNAPMGDQIEALTDVAPWAGPLTDAEKAMTEDAWQKHKHAAPAPGEGIATSELRVALQRGLIAALDDTYDCTRVWSAWSYRTMNENDFKPVLDRLDEIIDELVAHISQSPVYARPSPSSDAQGADCSDGLVVTQADRNAAVRILEDGGQDWQAKEVRLGQGDHFPLVQAFARHRVEAVRKSRQGLVVGQTVEATPDFWPDDTEAESPVVPLTAEQGRPEWQGGRERAA